MTDGGSRRDELAASLAGVRERIARACRDVGRDPDGVTLIAVTKTFPVTDARLLIELGQTDLAENRWQELREKAPETSGGRWHFVGQLQTNKAGQVARHVDVVQSVDRERLVTALGRAAVAAGRELGCLVQVDLDESADGADGDGEGSRTGRGRGGAAPDDVAGLADSIAGAEGLALLGVMAVAPRPEPGQEAAESADAAFARLASIHDDLLRRHPGATWRSAGMSGDLEAAIRHGATHVRVGRALLGERDQVG